VQQVVWEDEWKKPHQFVTADYPALLWWLMNERLIRGMEAYGKNVPLRRLFI